MTTATQVRHPGELEEAERLRSDDHREAFWLLLDAGFPFWEVTATMGTPGYHSKSMGFQDIFAYLRVHAPSLLDRLLQGP